MKYLIHIISILLMISTIHMEETTEESTTTAQVKKTCPNKDEYCLECLGSQCIRCGASYWDPNTEMCKAPIVKIDNCKIIIFLFNQIYNFPFSIYLF